MAEIRVPAWPIPIHQTKFVIANPHATGTFTPQMPTPFQRRYDTATRNSPKSIRAAAIEAYHKSGVGRVRIRPVIWSVTDANVCLGPRTGGLATGSTA